MGILRRIAARITHNDTILDGARELAAEYSGMLEAAGLPTRSMEVQDADGVAFISIDDVYGVTLAAVQGSPGPSGYLVAAAPFMGDSVTEYMLAAPGEGAFAPEEVSAETLDILRGAGLID